MGILYFGGPVFVTSSPAMSSSPYRPYVPSGAEIDRRIHAAIKTEELKPVPHFASPTEEEARVLLPKVNRSLVQAELTRVSTADLVNTTSAQLMARSTICAERIMAEREKEYLAKPIWRRSWSD